MTVFAMNQLVVLYGQLFITSLLFTNFVGVFADGMFRLLHYLNILNLSQIEKQKYRFRFTNYRQFNNNIAP